MERNGKTKKIELSEKERKWMERHFKHTKNADIAKKFGISESSMHRIAREMGLTKTRYFMKACQSDASAAAKVSNLANGTYPPKGFIIPRSEEFRFKKGETPRQRLGKKRDLERIQKSAQSRKATWQKEKARVYFGLPQKTKMKVVKSSRERVQLRWYLKSRGYVLDENERVAYWTDTTLRATRLERRDGLWYRFAKLVEE